MSLTKEDLSALSQMLDQQMENHLHPIKMELNELKTVQQQTQKDVTTLKLHLENTTDKSLQLLAENHISLINKLNQVIPAVEKNQQQTQKDVTTLKLHLENTTDKSLQLLAENHISLINKLNQVIPAVEKNLVYEVKVNYLMEEMQTFKKEVAFLKSKIA